MSDLTIRHRGTDITARPGTEITIGSDPTATLTVSHPGVSRRHAVIAFEGGVWRFRDTGSTNGSFIGGVRIDAAVIDASTVVLLGHEAEGEPLELTPDRPDRPLAADASVLRRIEIAVWITAAAAVGGLVVGILALLS